MDNSPIPIGEPVRVYWNIRKKCFSVQTDQEKGWRLALHIDSVRIQDVTFIVSDAGRERVRQEKRKNVHAYMEGFWAPDQMAYGAVVRYDPYEHEKFVCDNDPVDHAEFVYAFTSCGHPRVTAILWN